MLVIALVLGVVGGVGAVVNAIWGPHARARRRLRRGLRQIADGEVVTLVGKARRIDKTLVAPLSGRGCVAFHAVAHLFSERGRVHVDTIREHAIITFSLDTSEGTVVVDAEVAELALPVVPVIPRKLEREQAFLEAHQHPAREVPRATFEEIVVEVGDRIAVQGMAIVEQVQDRAERGYRDTPTRVRIVAHPAHPLTIGPPP